MPVKIRHRIDKLRRRFLWFGGNTVRKRHSLIAWNKVCRSKNQGGMGVLDLERMNRALLIKWLVRFYDDKITGTWKKVLIEKYSCTGESRIASAFWKDILKDKALVEVSANWQAGNGLSIRFWLDRWHGDCSLQCIYPNLFHIAYNKNILVYEVFDSQGIQIKFSRQLVGVYHREWCALLQQFQHFQLTNVNDQIVWRWTSHGRFTVHSLYTWLEFGGIPNTSFSSIWQANIPLKVRIFLWLVKQNKILTKDNLLKMGWTGNSQCVFCSEEESVDHLFINCIVAKSIWMWIANYNNFVFDCTGVSELWDIDACIPMKDSNLVELLRGAVLWPCG